MSIFELILGISVGLFGLFILVPLRKTKRDHFVYWGIIWCASVVILHGQGFLFEYRDPIFIGALIIGLATILFGYLSPWGRMNEKVKKAELAKAGTKIEVEADNDVVGDINAHSFLQQK